MTEIPSFDARWQDGDLHAAGAGLDVLLDRLMTRFPVALVRNVFPKEQLAKLREKVFRWGCETALAPAQHYADENFHAIEAGISPRQKTPHVYHAYNFNRPLELPESLGGDLMDVMEPLKRFQNKLTGNDAGYALNESGHKLHPQFIHYPSGGGMLGKHSHPLDPQRVGLILACSQRGSHFEHGGTFFEVGGEIVNSDQAHDSGDMLLFRFDIPHGISAIDVTEKFDPDSDRGRWTFVLPCY